MPILQLSRNLEQRPSYYIQEHPKKIITLKSLESENMEKIRKFEKKRPQFKNRNLGKSWKEILKNVLIFV